MGLIVVDTNILIYLSKKEINPQKLFFTNDEYVISIVTYMEILGFNFPTQQEEEFVRELLSYFPIIEIDKEIADKTIVLRKKYKIKLPDAIICATAIHNNALLITNDRQLKIIQELQIKHIKEIDENR